MIRHKGYGKGLPEDKDLDIDLSHFKADIKGVALSEDVQIHYRECYQKRHDDPEEWGRATLFDVNVHQSFETEDELRDFAEDLNRRAKQILQRAKQEAAAREARREKWEQQKKEARAEFGRWLNGLPLGGADAFKEDPNRFINTGGPHGRSYGEAKEMSYTGWALKKAQERWPEKVDEVREKLSEKYEGCSKSDLLYV